MEECAFKVCGRWIRPRRGTSEEWARVDPILAEGELSYDTDEKKFKRGDGKTRWSELPWYAALILEV